MTQRILDKGTTVTLLASYCGEEFVDCTDDMPCRECLKMCNNYELVDKVWARYIGQVDKTELECDL